MHTKKVPMTRRTTCIRVFKCCGKKTQRAHTNAVSFVHTHTALFYNRSMDGMAFLCALICYMCLVFIWLFFPLRRVRFFLMIGSFHRLSAARARFQRQNECASECKFNISTSKYHLYTKVVQSAPSTCISEQTYSAQLRIVIVRLQKTVWNSNTSK